MSRSQEAETPALQVDAEVVAAPAALWSLHHGEVVMKQRRQRL